MLGLPSAISHSHIGKRWHQCHHWVVVSSILSHVYFVPGCVRASLSSGGGSSAGSNLTSQTEKTLCWAISWIYSKGISSLHFISQNNFHSQNLHFKISKVRPRSWSFYSWPIAALPVPGLQLWLSLLPCHHCISLYENWVSLESRVWSLESGVWSLESGVWSLESRV